MKKKIFFLLLVLGYLFFHFHYLDKFLRVDIDDVYLCEPAWTYLKTGKVAVPTARGVFGSEEHNSQFGRLFIFAQLPFLSLIGVHPMSVRLPALFFGFILLWLTYILGKYLYDKKVAVLATTLLSLSGIFFLTTHHGRPDTMLAVFVLSAFLFFLKAREHHSPLLFFLSGLVSTLSADIHLNGVIVFLSIGFFFILDFRTKLIFSQHFWIWMGGALCGALWWVSLHILVNPTLFYEHWNGLVGGAYAPPVFSRLNPLPLWRMELERYLTGYWYGPAKRNLLEFLVILFSVGFIFVKNNLTYGEKKSILYVVSFLILFSIIVTQKTFWYLIYLYPFFMLWIADMTFHWTRVPLAFRVALLGALCLLYFTNIAVWAYKYRDANYDKFVKEVQSYIPPGASVMAERVLWFGLINYARSFASLTDSDAAGYRSVLGLDFAGYVKFWDTDFAVIQTDDYNLDAYNKVRPFFESSATPVGKVTTKYFGAGAVSETKYKEFTIFKIN